MSNSVKTAAVALMALVAATGMATAQTYERAGAQRDWSVFAIGSGADRVCWVVSQPKSWVARRGGSQVNVNRGDIYLMVANRPAQGVPSEVSVVAGYPYRENASVEVRIGSDEFEFFTRGENAWPENQAADSRVVEAMKRGIEAVVTGVSSRGTTTVDTFSLLGFTAAFDEAERLCA